MKESSLMKRISIVVFIIFLFIGKISPVQKGSSIRDGVSARPPARCSEKVGAGGLSKSFGKGNPKYLPSMDEGRVNPKRHPGSHQL